LEGFPALLRLYKKSIYEVKVADMIASGATVAELEAFTELHCITPQAIRGVDGMPMIHLAAQHNRRHILEWLLQKGSDAHATDRKGNSALQVATHFNSSDVLAYLVPVEVPVDRAAGETAYTLQVPVESNDGCRPASTTVDSGGSDSSTVVVTADGLRGSNSSTVVVTADGPGGSDSSIVVVTADGLGGSNSSTVVVTADGLEGSDSSTVVVTAGVASSSQDYSNIHPLHNESIVSDNVINGISVGSRRNSIPCDSFTEVITSIPSAATEASTDDDWECVTSRKQRKLIIRSEKIRVKVPIASKDKPTAAPQNRAVIIPKEKIGICDVAAVRDVSDSSQLDCEFRPLENESKSSDDVNNAFTMDGQNDTSASEPCSVAISSLPPAATEASTDEGWECVTSRKQRMRLTRSKK